MLNPDENSRGVEDGIGVKLLLIPWVFVGSVVKTGKDIGVSDGVIDGEDVTAGCVLHPVSIRQRVRKKDGK
jgi:hypothetical protein